MLQASRLCKAFGPRVIFDDFTIDFPARQTTAIIGSNGCGKSTLINLLSGSEPCDRGQIHLDGQPIQQARIGYVCQNYAASLFPWLTAQDNLCYPLKLQHLPIAAQRDRLRQLITAYDVKFDLDRYPYMLSGGQQQLLAILRSVIVKPTVLFLDEPFTALDLSTRLAMRTQLRRICQDLAATTIIVSHDLDDAIYLADRIVVLSQPPTQIIATIPVPQSDRACQLTDPRLIAVKQRCLDLIQPQLSQ
jgi:NitT/TauT family transport system ATP-binding protein